MLRTASIVFCPMSRTPAMNVSSLIACASGVKIRL